MKYEVGQIIYAIDPCKMKFDGRQTLTVGKGYEVAYADELGVYIEDDESSPHFFDHEDAVKFFSIDKNLNEVTANNGLKHTPEQQEYIDKCAIAAMQAYITNGGAPPDIAICAYEMADSMLVERERGAKQ